MAKTFRLLEQPCALRLPDEPGDAEGGFAAYDLPLPESDYAAGEPPRRRHLPARPAEGGAAGERNGG